MKIEQEEDNQDKEIIQAGNIVTVSKSILERICSFTNIVEEVKIKLSREAGIRIRAVDPSHVMLRDLHIRHSMNLVPHLVNVERDMEIATNLAPITDMLPLMAEDDKIVVGCTEGRRMLTFKYGRHYHEIVAVDMLGMSEPKMPDLKLVGAYKVDIKELMVSLKVIGKIRNHVDFVGDENNLEVRIIGNHEYNESSYTGSFNGSCTGFIGTADEVITALFPIDYIDSVLRAHNKLKDTEVTIEFSTDYPVKFIIEKHGITDIHLLAPRLETDSSSSGPYSKEVE